MRFLLFLLVIRLFGLIPSPLFANAQLPASSVNNADDVDAASALDSLLQDYAYRAFLRPRTGVDYNAVLPANLTGIRVSAMRLRAGSLRTRGVPMFNEFRIPVGVVELHYVERLVLVYSNLGNWSSIYYRLDGYVFLTPVLGLLAYDASNLSAKNLPVLDIRPSSHPISIKFSALKSVPKGSVAKCVAFDLHGSVNFSNLLPDNICSTFQQGHFGIVVESIAHSPGPQPMDSPGQAPIVIGKVKKSNSKMWIIVGSVLGGLALLVVLGVVVAWVHKYKRRSKMQQMEKAADVGETLHMTNVGSTKAPAASVTRTQPSLESEYTP